MTGRLWATTYCVHLDETLLYSNSAHRQEADPHAVEATLRFINLGNYLQLFSSTCILTTFNSPAEANEQLIISYCSPLLDVFESLDIYRLGTFIVRHLWFWLCFHQVCCSNFGCPCFHARVPYRTALLVLCVMMTNLRVDWLSTNSRLLFRKHCTGSTFFFFWLCFQLNMNTSAVFIFQISIMYSHAVWRPRFGAWSSPRLFFLAILT